MQMCVWASDGGMANLSTVIGERAVYAGVGTGGWVEEVVDAGAGTLQVAFIFSGPGAS